MRVNIQVDIISFLSEVKDKQRKGRRDSDKETKESSSDERKVRGEGFFRDPAVGRSVDREKRTSRDFHSPAGGVG